MISKDIGLLGKADLEELVQEQVPEGRTIDYKLTLPTSTDDGKKEFLADISSFANASGGDLIYGILESRTSDNKPTGLPQEVKGLGSINQDSELLRLESMIRDGIAPRIEGIRLRFIEGFSDGAALLIRVPRSWRSPHLVSYKGGSRFFSRTSAGKYQLDVTEIRSAFIHSEGIADRVKNFRDSRIARIRAGEATLPMPQGPRTVLHLIPLGNPSETTLIDSGMLEQNKLSFGPIYSSAWSTRFNLDGLLLYAPSRPNEPTRTYLQLYRTGAIEAVSSDLVSFDIDDKEKTIASFTFEDVIISSTQSYVTGLQALRVAMPIAVMLTLTGVRDFTMGVDKSKWAPFFRTHKIDRDILFLPDVLIEDYRANIAEALKPVFDALWQSAGWPSSHYYDKDGHRISQ